MKNLWHRRSFAIPTEFEFSAHSRKAAEHELRAKFCCLPALTRKRSAPQNFMAWTIVRAKLLGTLSDDQTFSSFHQQRRK